MAQPDNTWTKPYCGVTHLNTGDYRQFQYTVEMHKHFCIVKEIPLVDCQFISMTEALFGTLEEAQAWAEGKYAARR